MPVTNDLIKLRAQAKKAGVPNYGSMSRAELKAAVADAGSGSKPSKRKSAASVSGVKRGGSKRKSASTVASSKPKRKQAEPASEGMSERQAKRIVSKYEGKRGRRPAEYHEAMAVLGDNPAPASKRKPKAQSQRKAVSRASSNGKPGRNRIDASKVDWSAEWPGGQSGNRAIIFKALRRFKGDYAKVLKSLIDNAHKMYPKSSKTGERYTKAEAVKLLKWHINRTAFDFVTGTDQHTISTNRKADKRSAGRKSKPAAAASDNGSVSDMSDRALRKLVSDAAGRRGRKSERVRAAISELEARSGSKPKAKSTRTAGRRQNRSQSRARTSQRAGGRTRRSTRKRVKA